MASATVRTVTRSTQEREPLPGTVEYSRGRGGVSEQKPVLTGAGAARPSLVENLRGVKKNYPRWQVSYPLLSARLLTELVSSARAVSSFRPVTQMTILDVGPMRESLGRGATVTGTRLRFIDAEPCTPISATSAGGGFKSAPVCGWESQFYYLVSVFILRNNLDTF
jgi:hypothetical protein